MCRDASALRCASFRHSKQDYRSARQPISVQPLAWFLVVYDFSEQLNVELCSCRLSVYEFDEVIECSTLCGSPGDDVYDFIGDEQFDFF